VRSHPGPGARQGAPRRHTLDGARARARGRRSDHTLAAARYGGAGAFTPWTASTRWHARGRRGVRIPYGARLGYGGAGAFTPRSASTRWHAWGRRGVHVPFGTLLVCTPGGAEASRPGVHPTTPGRKWGSPPPGKTQGPKPEKSRRGPGPPPGKTQGPKQENPEEDQARGTPQKIPGGTRPGEHPRKIPGGAPVPEFTSRSPRAGFRGTPGGVVTPASKCLRRAVVIREVGERASPPNTSRAETAKDAANLKGWGAPSPNLWRGCPPVLKQVWVPI